MSKTNSNPVTVNGAGADSQNQVIATKVLFLVIPCDDTYYRDNSIFFREVPNFENDPEEAIEAFKKLYKKHLDDEFDPREFSNEEINEIRKIMFEINGVGFSHEFGFVGAFHLKDAVWVNGKFFVETSGVI